MATVPKTGLAERAGIIVKETEVQRTLIRDAITLNLDGEKVGLLHVLADLLWRVETIEQQAEEMVEAYERARSGKLVELGEPTPRPGPNPYGRQDGDC